MITVNIRNDVRYVPVVGTLLESLEKSGVSIETHCRGGFCGACRMKLKQGEVKEVIQPLAYLEDDEILACCSRPETQRIEVEVL